MAKQISAKGRSASGGKKTDHSSPYLETDKEHKKWYSVWEMGKQRGKPKAIPPKVKKQKGEFRKHRHK